MRYPPKGVGEGFEIRAGVGRPFGRVNRIADAAGTWLAVAFLPADVALASGPAAGRRQYLDRLLYGPSRPSLACAWRLTPGVSLMDCLLSTPGNVKR